MIQVQKTKDKVTLSITTQLDKEDVYQLAKDLLDWCFDNDTKRVDSQNAGPSGLTFHNKEHYEAYLQAQSKLALSKEIQKDIEERFGDKYYITKEGKAIKKEKYDIVPSEIELEQLKLKKQNGKKAV